MAETQSTVPTTTEATAPTGDIKIFIDAFNKDFDVEIKQLVDAQQNYKNVYADAIKITTPKEGPWPNDPKVVTIGDLFKYTFPDINSDKIVKPPAPRAMDGDRPGVERWDNYFGWQKDLSDSKDEKIKKMYGTILNGINSNSKLLNFQDLKKPGITNPSLWSPGQYYFDVFMSRMLSSYGPLKDPTEANGGSNGIGTEYDKDSFYSKNGGSVSVANFDPTGEAEYSKLSNDTALDYSSFHNILSSGYVGSGIKYKMEDFTGVNIGGFDEDYKFYPARGIPTPPSSFPSLRVQYKSGVLSQFISGKREDWLKNLNWNGYRGSITDAAGKDVEYEVALDDNTDKSTLNFNGNYEHMLLYKAFIQAGDNYKSVVLPLRNPEPEPVDAPVTVLAKVVAPTAVGEVQFKFNVEKKDTFIVVGGTVSPPLELIIVPNDGTTYIIETPDDIDIFDPLDDIDDEYEETESELTEEEMIANQAVYDIELGLEGLNYRPVSRYHPKVSSNGTAVTNTPNKSKKSGKGTWQKAVAALPDSATFKARVEKFATEYNTTADQFYRVMYAESRIQPDAYNKNGGASGLIQFMPSTAKGLGTTTDHIRSLSATQQMDYVEKYFRKAGLRKGATVYDMYALVFFPIIVGKSDDWIIQTKKLSAELVSRSNPAIARAAGKTKGTPLNVSDFKKYVDSIS